MLMESIPVESVRFVSFFSGVPSMHKMFSSCLALSVLVILTSLTGYQCQDWKLVIIGVNSSPN